MTILAFWTSGQLFIHKAYLLLVFAGIWALMEGTVDIVRAFEIRQLHKSVLTAARPSAQTRPGRDQSELTSTVDRFLAAMRVELGVDAAHMGPDRVGERRSSSAAISGACEVARAGSGATRSSASLSSSRSGSAAHAPLAAQRAGEQAE